uniref:Cyclic nucleotide-binding domain-containing protein n=1 Tax=Hyaloperonospora arabidopsidis (strain Emoy2) TaxID=559515 RepID=M4B2G4_HYAAE
MHIAATASNIGPLPFHGDDKWVQRHLIHRDAERVERNSPESSYSSVETVCFNRAEFTKQIQALLDADVSDGFVIGLKHRREFALRLCEDYKVFTEKQKLELVLALAVDLGVRDLARMMKTLPSIKRSGLVLNVTAAALGFSRKNHPNISKSVKRGLVPLAEQLFLLVGTIQPGPLFLLNLRVDLGALIERNRHELPTASVEALELLDLIMRDLFATQGSMRFHRIDLSSEDLAAFVLKNERVHQVRSWNDLRRRLVGRQRYCFGLFHMHMPYAPLVFVQVAVTDGLCNSIAPILEQETPVVKNPSHIIFYSVSTSNTGLRGLNIASHLLFLTIQRMISMFPQCSVAATLSPVPGFAGWFKAALANGDQQSQRLSDAKSPWKTKQYKNPKLQHLERCQRSFFTAEQTNRLSIRYGANQLGLHKWLLHKISEPEWHKEVELLENIRDIITAACARYVLFERKRDKILDPVANFHLQNGAQVEQINFMADTSPSALTSALGMMVNYRYCMMSVDATSASYKRGSLAAVSPAAARLFWSADSAILDGETSNVQSSGTVRVHSVHSYTLSKGQTFGEHESLNDEPVAFTVRAETSTYLLLLPYNDVKAIQLESKVLRDYIEKEQRVWQQPFQGSKL